MGRSSFVLVVTATLPGKSCKPSSESTHRQRSLLLDRDSRAQFLGGLPSRRLKYQPCDLGGGRVPDAFADPQESSRMCVHVEMRNHRCQGMKPSQLALEAAP